MLSARAAPPSAADRDAELPAPGKCLAHAPPQEVCTKTHIQGGKFKPRGPSDLV